MPANELPIPFAGAGSVLAAAIALPVVGCIVVGLRFFVRQTQKDGGGLRADDWSILAALICLIAMGIAQIWGVAKGGLGYPTPEPLDFADHPSEQLTNASPEQRATTLVEWITWVTMIPANGLIKLSALFFCRRLFVVHSNTLFDLVSKSMLVICVFWTIAFEAATIFGCRTHWGYPWTTLTTVAACNTDVRLDGLMVSDLITDILVRLLPIPILWSLNMRTSRKISASGIMLLAAMSLPVAIVRLIANLDITRGGYGADTDVDLTLTVLLYWSMIESGLALVAASLPVLRPLLREPVFRQAFSDTLTVLHISHLRRSVGSSGEGSIATLRRAEQHEAVFNVEAPGSSTKTARDKYEIRDQDFELTSSRHFKHAPTLEEQ